MREASASFAIPILNWVRTAIAIAPETVARPAFKATRPTATSAIKLLPSAIPTLVLMAIIAWPLELARVRPANVPFSCGSSVVGVEVVNAWLRLNFS